MRLARFNIQTTKPQPHAASSKKSFVGMPIPAGAGLIAAIVHHRADHAVAAGPCGIFWWVSSFPDDQHHSLRASSIDMRSRKSYVTSTCWRYWWPHLPIFAGGAAILARSTPPRFLMKIYQMVKHKNEVILPADQLFPSHDDTK
jgi:hypothetical protein